MTEGYSRRQLTLLLWALVLLGLMTSGAIATYVGWSLAELSDENASSQSLQQRMSLDIEHLRRLTIESHALTMELLLAGDLSNPATENTPLLELKTAVSSAGQYSPLINALSGRVVAITDIWERTQQWYLRYTPVAIDIRQEYSVGNVRKVLQRLQASLDSLEGRHNLYIAQLMRRWKAADGDVFITLAQQVREEETKLWPRALQAAKTEATELTRLIERLSIQKNLSDLADIKNNLLKPSIDRLSRQLAVLNSHLPVTAQSRALEISPVVAALFGTEYRPDPVHQTIVVGNSGLFPQQRTYLELEQVRQKLLREAEQQEADNHLVLQSMTLLATTQLTSGRQETEQRLAQALLRMALSVGALAVLFLFLGIFISRHIRSQFSQLAELQRENELILNSAGEGVIGLTAAGNMRFINPSASTMLGIAVDSMIGQPLHRIWKTEVDGSVEADPVIAFGARVIDKHSRLLRADGRSFAVEYSSMPMIRKGVQEGAVITFRDISESEQVKASLQESEQKFRDLSEKSLVGVYIIQNGLFTYVNPHFSEIFGYSRDEIELHLGPQDLSHPDDFKLVARNIEKRISGVTDSIDYSIRGIRKDGSEINIELLGSSTQYGGEAAIIGTLVDVTDRTKAEAKVQHQAYHDPLTGLPNRLLCNDRLEHALNNAQRLNLQLAVLFLDLDRFKHVNDSLGHSVGDALLVSIAGRLNNTIRQADTVARQGGDEFIVILEAIGDSSVASAIAKKIQDAFAQPIILSGHELYVTASIGISLYPEDGTSADTLIKNADAAMYQAKHKGRSTFAFYTSDLTLTSTEWLDLESALRRALVRDEMYLEYQPQIDLNSGKLVGVEALLRWRHPERGLISPIKFIPLAEETGLILEIGDWVLDQACLQISCWQQQGYHSPLVAVNLSSIQVFRGDIVASVEQALVRHSIDPGYLELEITENCIMENTEKSSQVLQALRDRGISLAIDDFGTGYSSLAYLKQLPINKLKIDQSFIADIPHDLSDEAIAKAIIMLGQLLNLEIIAEGVETVEQQQFVHKNGCNLAQGFLFSRPVAPEVIATMLSAQSDAEPQGSLGS
ncbi:MAG: EAL domain-containing protein [Motiliproteus sp.]